MRAVRTFLSMALLLAFAPFTPAAAAPPMPNQHEMTIQAAPLAPVPATAPDARLLTLTAFGALAAVVGRQDKGRMVRLNGAYLFDGTTYGPTTADEPDGTWVPEDFPELDKDGVVIHEPGTAAARNAARNRDPRKPFSSPPNTGGVNTGEGITSNTATVSGKSAEELDSMTKADLEALAETSGIPVTRQDDEGNEVEGEPLKADYIRALSARRTPTT